MTLGDLCTGAVNLLTYKGQTQAMQEDSEYETNSSERLCLWLQVTKASYLKGNLLCNIFFQAELTHSTHIISLSLHI